MSDKENTRKCVKCGASPAKHNVKLFRFPKPGVRNLIRCTFWAKYLFPMEKNKYASVVFQKKLYNEHRMLCENHFSNEDFTDNSKKRLLQTAVPHDIAELTIDVPMNLGEPQPSTSSARPHLSVITNTADRASKVVINSEPEGVVTSMPGPKGKLTEVEKKTYAKCEKYMHQICQLNNKIKKLKSAAVLKTLLESQSAKKLAKVITPTFALLLQGQIRNSKRKSTGRRWPKEEKIVALRLYKRSPTLYRLMRKMMFLPSPGTLKALLNKVPFEVGATKPVFEVLKHYIQNQPPSDNKYILMFDEMSIKKHLEYSNKTDAIEGFQDHGDQGRSPVVASYAFVFMLGCIRKPVKQPIAHYFSGSYVTADRLAVLIKDILKQCFQAGINVSAMVCDMDGVNRRALSILGATTEKPYIELNNKEIVTLYDTPHLLKCFRNLFLKYDLECPVDISSGELTGRGIAKWSHIKDFFEIDNANPNFVFAPVLTKTHLEPNTKQKMRVNLAAQVLSHTVAAGIYAKVFDGTLPTDATITANVLSKMDKLFDCLNSDTTDLRRGKKCATNMTEKSPHFQVFKDMKFFFQNIKFRGCTRPPPSQEGWIWTINAMERLFKNLKEEHDNIKSLSTRRVQQDALENLFGCIRGNCGSNANPTTVQFVAGLKTAILSSLAHIGTKGNCEADNNTIMNNFDKLLSVPHSPDENKEQEMTTPEFSVSSTEVQADSAEVQACAYVCGFIIKKLPHNCDNCKKLFQTADVDHCHTFTECKEYDELKKHLKYASKAFIDYIEKCATATNDYLNQHAHKKKLKATILNVLKHNANHDFLSSCQLHMENNLTIILNTTFEICVKRFCILKNRIFADEAASSALRRKMKIIVHK